MTFGFLQIGFTDIIDIIFVAVLLCTAIVWIKRTRAAFVLIGIFILGLIYLLARQFGLQLTAWIFQGFFAILLIIIVVIFQEELRQFFERIAVWSLRRTVREQQYGVLDTLVKTLADFARDRIGALIVIPGHQPIGRHIEGGIALGGRLSEPLLKSVFDIHSPGHDGAVIIEKDRIDRFAVHLPLSKDFQQLSRVGTRHSAALGLAELTDALCLVVSEERGRISVARYGQLKEVDNLPLLKSLLQEFLNEKSPPPGSKKLSTKFLRENWIVNMVSLLLAIGLWILFVAGSKLAQITYPIHIQVDNLAPGLVLEEVEPPEVQVTLTGPRRGFYFLDKKKLAATIDVSLAQWGRRTFRVSEQNIRYPKDLTLKEVTPSRVKLSVKNKPPNKAKLKARLPGSQQETKPE
ncbi:MAG: diadenylate cyclase [Candidatus Binatia bacterium]